MKCCLLFSPVVILKKLQDIIRPRYTKNHTNKSFCDIDGCPNGRFYFFNAFSSFYVKFLIHLNTIIWYHFHFLLYIFYKVCNVCLSCYFFKIRYIIQTFFIKIIITCRRSLLTLYIHLTNLKVHVHFHFTVF